MVVKIKEKFEKTRQVKNNDKSKKYNLRGRRNTRYHEKILSIQKKSNNITFYVDKEIQDIMKTFCQIKRNLII